MKLLAFYGRPAINSFHAGWNLGKAGLSTKKLLRIMKLTAILLLSACLTTSAKGISQNVTLSVKEVPVQKVFEEIKKQTGLSFMWDEATLKETKPVTLDVRNMPVADVLNRCVKGQPISYRIIQKLVVVKLTNAEDANAADNQPAPPEPPKKISGVILGSNGTPLVSASINVKNSQLGTTTDGNGKFSLELPETANVLVISYIGYETIELPVSKSGDIRISLKPTESKMTDVVIVGYGAQKKIDLTGAVATVNGGDLAKRHITNPAASLEGLISGVRVVQSSGQPGAEGVGIEIRGMGTYSGAGSYPLVLVNGVQGNLADIDPNNIESISVLKDAASAAIYGARAANGVILVTTKDGSTNGGKFTVSYDFNYGISRPTKMPDLVTNSAQYMNLFNVAKTNSGITAASQFYPDSIINLYRNPSDLIKYPNADWASLMFRTAPTMMHYFSVSGGQKTTYNASVGYTDQQGVMQAFNYKKYTAQFNVASTVSSKFKMGFNIGLKNGDQSQPLNGAQDAFYQTIAHAPTALPTVADGSGRYTYRTYNWESVRPNQFAANNQLSSNIDFAITSQLWTDLEIIKGLHWYTKGAINGYFTRSKTFSSAIPLLNYLYPDSASLSSNIPGNGLTESMTETIYKNLFSYISYDKSFQRHQFGLQLGYSQEEQDYQYLMGARTSYSTDVLHEINAGDATPQYNGGTSNAWALQSFFGRLKYNFGGKYLFEANMRGDGSSRFADGHKWGYFPSFSAAWRMTEEPFMQRMKESGWLSDAKLRASWGQLGNQNIGLYPYQSLVNIGANYPFGNNLVTGAYQSGLNNENITWETTTMSDIGLDLTLLKHLNITVDAYKKYTADILRTAQVTGVVGLSAPTINDGAMTNVGLEFSVNYRNNVSSGALQGLAYNMGFNINGFKNETTKFGKKQDNGSTVIEEGSPWNSFYLLQWDGIFQSQDEINKSPKQFGENTQPGDLKFKDINHDGVIDNNDRVKMTKGVFPAFTYGFNLSASWKGFDMYCFLQGVQGQKGIFGYGRTPGLTPFFSGTPPTKDVAEQAWTPENHSNTMPRLYFSDYSGSEKVWNHPSTFLLYDMSYLRIKNLQFGYTLPDALMKKMSMKGIRIYVAADNLSTFTKFPGLDPEKPTGAFLSYPQNKTISFGLSAKF